MIKKKENKRYSQISQVYETKPEYSMKLAF